MSVSAEPRHGESRLASKSVGRGTTVEWRRVTGGSGVQWVKTLITQRETPVFTEQHLHFQHSTLDY